MVATTYNLLFEGCDEVHISLTALLIAKLSADRVDEIWLGAYRVHINEDWVARLARPLVGPMGSGILLDLL